MQTPSAAGLGLGCTACAVCSAHRSAPSAPTDVMRPDETKKTASIRPPQSPWRQSWAGSSSGAAAASARPPRPLPARLRAVFTCMPPFISEAQIDAFHSASRTGSPVLANPRHPASMRRASASAASAAVAASAVAAAAAAAVRPLPVASMWSTFASPLISACACSEPPPACTSGSGSVVSGRPVKRCTTSIPFCRRATTTFGNPPPPPPPAAAGGG
eukprot:scaffold106777_cov54-Phaeocystis_antarctica.AAC.2